MSYYHIHTKPNGVQKVGAAAIKRLLPIASKFKYLVVTGQSGIIPGSIAAYALHKDLVILRKESEETNGQPIEAPNSFHYLHRNAKDASDWTKLASKCCILDDFICSGLTLQRLSRELEFLPRYVALYTKWEQDSRIRNSSILHGTLTKLSFNLYQWRENK